MNTIKLSPRFSQMVSPFWKWILIAFLPILVSFSSGCGGSSESNEQAIQDLLDSLRQDSIAISNHQSATTNEAQSKGGDSSTTVKGSKPTGNRGAIAQSGWRNLIGAHYEILFPESWEKDRYLIPGILFRLRVPMVEADDSFQESLNLTSESVEESTTLATYSDAGLQQIKEMYPNCKMIENAPVNGPNGTYNRIIYSTGLMGMQVEQCCWVKDATAWVLTFTSEEAHFQEYKEVLKKVMDSFVTN